MYTFLYYYWGATGRLGNKNCEKKTTEKLFHRQIFKARKSTKSKKQGNN